MERGHSIHWERGHSIPQIEKQGDLTNNELDAIIQTIRTMPEEQSELARTIFKAAADSLSLDKAATLTGQDTTTLQNKQQTQNGLILRFTEKENNS